MLKIALFDSWNGKFSKDIRIHWESLGNEVISNPTWDTANTCDLAFFYQADNAFVETTVNSKLPNVGKIFAQCVDIEVWANQPQSADWSKVTGCLFMAKHIMDKVLRETQIPCPIQLIKPGIDTQKFYFRDPTPLLKDPVRRIAYVVGDRRIWDVKRLDLAFMLLKDAMRLDPEHIWQLHIRGTYSSHEQYNAYCRYLEKDLDLSHNVVWYEERVEDLSKWLDYMLYFLLPSTKEAFSYATAECMAKGIKPILNNWEGSRETWGNYVCDTYGRMLSNMIDTTYEAEKYRDFVLNNYDNQRYFRQLDGFVLGGGDSHG